jgi:hypothetical protein
VTTLFLVTPKHAEGGDCDIPTIPN